MSYKPSKIIPTLAYEGIIYVAYFPGWWYTVGFFRFLKGLASSLSDWNDTLGVSIWIKNIFRPLFSQYDFAGRVLSFFLRVANIIVRGIALILVAAAHLVIAALWLIAPAYCLFQLLFR